MNNDALQIIVTILGIVSQVVLLIKEMPQKKDPDPGATNVVVEPPKAEGHRSVLDLSFVLLCSTFFSLILMDSLVISGRTPSPGPSTIMKVLAITAVVFGMMFCAWRINQSELVTGFLAMIILTVLIISPGGPFGASAIDGKNVQSGLTLYVPVMILVTIAATMMIYSFGNPTSNVVERRKRYLVGLTLIVLLIVGAVSLGQHLVTKVMKAENTPKIQSNEGKQLLREISGWQWSQRQKFYQLAAEVTLAYKYQKDYLEIRGMQRQIQPTPTPTPEQPEADVDDDEEPSPKPPSSAQAKPSPSTAPTPVVSPSPTPRPSPSPSPENRKIPDAIFTSAGSERINELVERFCGSQVNSQEKYLRQRLDWIHPVGQEKAQSSLPLTGITIEDRVERIGFFRLVQSLIEQPNVQRSLLEEFNYPSEVVSYFKDEDGIKHQWKNAQLKLPKLIEDLQPAKKESTSQITLLPPFKVGDSRLRLQLSLPMEVESSIAYNEYAHLALQLVLDRISNSQDKTNGKAIAEDFDKQLSDDAKNALRYYVANDQSPLDVLQSLVKLSEVDLNFDPLADGSTAAPWGLKSKLEAYRDSPPSSPPTDSRLAALAYNIVTKTNNKDVTNTIIRLLEREDYNTPIAPLFRRPVFELVKRIDRLDKDSKLDFFNAVADPVWPVVQQMAHNTAAEFKDEKFFDQPLNVFRNGLPDNRERNNLLHQLAISIYQPGGDFSLDPISLLVVEAKGWNDTAALFCAAVIMLPLLFICVLSSAYFSRKLVARDRMRELISKELQGYTQSFSTVGNPVELQGRDDVLRSLRSLAERGWSTIGVVGRRGVGKSRILYGLSQSNRDYTEIPTIRVWVASPSRFQEEDFIASIFERLAISTESAIASFLNAKPLSIRRIESRATHVTLWYYVAVVCLLLIVVFQMYDRLTSADIVITWLPIAALLFSSVILLLHYISRLQPVDLSSWLQRDRAHNPHTVLLYREVNEALRYLRRRAQQAAGNVKLGRPARHLTMRICSIIFWVALAVTWLMSEEGWATVLTCLLIVAAAGGSWVLLYRQREALEDGAATQGQSMMSLIAEYRSFAATIVYRLKQGALGHSANRRFSVLICVDELDKIVDFEEIRMFVRRIKAIFEVPGVYYYVSLAEDTLKALYLGASAGKNEIDSSFDHIVRIPPVTCEVGEAIATHYLQAHAVDELPPRLARTIATLSYGIPRDIIRRCDEYIASVNGARVSSGALVAELRKKQASLGYELRHLSSSQVRDVSGDALSTAMTVQRLLGNNSNGDHSNGDHSSDEKEQQQRLILSLWLNALIEAVIDVPDEESWRALSEKLCAIGYELSDEHVADLQPAIEGLQARIFNGNGKQA